MRRIFPWLLLAFFTAASYGQGAEPKATRILFIGNSLTYSGDVPGGVAKLAGAMGHTVEVETVAFPDYSLSDHWRDGRALAAIRKGWDVVVLQQGTSAQDDSRTELIDFTKRFAAEIRKAGARPALYQVWPSSERTRDFPAAIRNYRLAAEAVDGLLIPVGEAWLRVLSKDKRVRLYADGIHPSSIGSDLCVVTIYLSLFPAGPQEFTEAYIRRIERTLAIPVQYTDLFVDAATRAIDEPMALK